MPHWKKYAYVLFSKEELLLACKDNRYANFARQQKVARQHCSRLGHYSELGLPFVPHDDRKAYHGIYIVLARTSAPSVVCVLAYVVHTSRLDLKLQVAPPPTLAAAPRPSTLVDGWFGTSLHAFLALDKASCVRVMHRSLSSVAYPWRQIRKHRLYYILLTYVVTCSSLAWGTLRQRKSYCLFVERYFHYTSLRNCGWQKLVLLSAFDAYIYVYSS